MKKDTVNEFTNIYFHWCFQIFLAVVFNTEMKDKYKTAELMYFSEAFM